MWPRRPPLKERWDFSGDSGRRVLRAIRPRRAPRLRLAQFIRSRGASTCTSVRGKNPSRLSAHLAIAAETARSAGSTRTCTIFPVSWPCRRGARGGARGARGAPISARTAAHGSRSAAIARDVFLQPRLQQTQPPKCRPDSASRYVRACSNDQSKTSPRSALTSVCPTKSCPSFRTAPPPPSRKPLDRGLRNSLGEPLLRRRGA